jgi:lysophospholipase L1-like esterase
VATVVALGAAELVLRVVWHNPYRHESPDHLVKLRMHHARTDHVYKTGLPDAGDSEIHLRTDERSYLLPSERRAGAVATVVFLGGSTTECAAVQEDVRFPALVPVLMAEKGLTINTLNGGHSGNNVHDIINIVFNHVIEDKPDIAVLMEASNDVGTLRAAKSYASSMDGPVSLKLATKWIVQMMSSRSALVGLVRQSATREQLKPKDPGSDWRQTQAPADSAIVGLYRAHLKTFVHMCRDFGIEPVLMTQPYSRHRNALTPAWLESTAQDQFNDIIREVGQSENVLVIDLVTHVRAIPGWDTPNQIFYDAIHVNKNGSRVYAAYIAEELQPLIQKSAQAGR